MRAQYDDVWERRDVLGVHAQKQEGYSWVGACVPTGRIFPDDLYAFADVCEKCPPCPPCPPCPSHAHSQNSASSAPDICTCGGPHGTTCGLLAMLAGDDRLCLQRLRSPAETRRCAAGMGTALCG